jgi:hypothetical protein
MSSLGPVEAFFNTTKMNDRTERTIERRAQRRRRLALCAAAPAKAGLLLAGFLHIPEGISPCIDS